MSEQNTKNPVGRPRKHQATGEEKPITDVYELIGIRKTIIMGEKSLEEYTDYLEGLDLAELQDHVLEVNAGIVPTDDKERMIDKLRKIFAQEKGSAFAAANNVEEEKINRKSEEAALKILKRGR